MHIAMVTETYPPEVNGVARTVALMAEGLRALGHSIQLVRPRQGASDTRAGRRGYAELLRPGMPIPRYTQLKMGLPSRRALLRAWREQRPDVVHIATEGPLGWSALAAARQLGTAGGDRLPHQFPRLQQALRRRLARAPGDGGTCAASTTAPTAPWCRPTRWPRSWRALGFERLRVVGRGVNARTFSPAKRRAGAARRNGAPARTTPVALCVSRFAPEKNFPLVLEAYEAMRRAQPATRAGAGRRRADAEPSCARRNTGSVIAGRLVNGELSAHYASADVFLFPSVTETFGNVTLEAMASGLAVVAYRYAAARQHLEHGALRAARAESGDRAGFIAHGRALARDPAAARVRSGAPRAPPARPVSWERITADFEAVLLDTAHAPPCAGRRRMPRLDGTLERLQRWDERVCAAFQPLAALPAAAAAARGWSAGSATASSGTR